MTVAPVRAAVRVRLRRAALNPAAVRLLHKAYRYWAQQKIRLADAEYLSEEDRAILRPVLRRWSVLIAPAQLSRTRYIEYFLGVIGAVVCLVGPVAALESSARRELSLDGLVCAVLIYLGIFGAISAAYFEAVGIRFLSLIGVAGGLSAFIAASIAVIWAHKLSRSLEFGVIAGLLAALTIAVISTSMRLFASYLWYPIRRQPLLAMSPSWAAAARLWLLADSLDQAMSSWRRIAVRREQVNRVGYTCYWLEAAIPRTMWMTGYRGPAHREARSRFRQLASFAREQAWRIVDANDREAFGCIRDDLAHAAVSLAKGDWTFMPPNVERNRPPWILALARRLIAPIALVGAAIFLPYLPDIDVTGSGLTSLRATLVLAAVLSLTPLDAPTREQMLDIYNGNRTRR
jgi:hypothetical protein